MKDHDWANTILNAVEDHEVIAVLNAVNELSRDGLPNRGAVIVACAQILAQNIVSAPPDIVREIRDGIMMLIDDCAMKLKTEAP